MRLAGRTSAGGSRRPRMPVARPSRPAFGPAADGRLCGATAPARGHTHPHRPASPRNGGTYRARMPGNSAGNGMPCCVTKWWVKWSVDRAVSGSGYGPVKLSRAGDDRRVVSGEPSSPRPGQRRQRDSDLRVHRRTANDKHLSPGAPIPWAGEPPGQSLPNRFQCRQPTPDRSRLTFASVRRGARREGRSQSARSRRFSCGDPSPPTGRA